MRVIPAVILLLQFWPQWRAIRIMRLDFKNDPKTENKKKELMREFTTTEPFLEAWPSIIIMTIIWLSALYDRSFSDYCSTVYGYIPNTGNGYKDEECNEYLESGYQPPNYCTNHPENDRCAVYGGLGGQPWFFTTYAISIITGSLGITKFLQVGPFSVLTSEGASKGICKCRFFLAFMAVMTSMVMKGLFIGVFFNYISIEYVQFYDKPFYENPGYQKLGTSDKQEAKIRMLLLLAGLLVLTNLLFSWISICCSTGFNKKLTQVILAYPATWMLPIATYFMIGPQKSYCCSKTNVHQYHLGFSKPCTIINIILTVTMYAGIFTYFAYYFLWGYTGMVLLLSLVFNIAFMLSDLKCCCFCCCNNDCRKHETHVIATNTLKLDIVTTEN